MGEFIFGAIFGALIALLGVLLGAALTLAKRDPSKHRTKDNDINY